MLNADEGRPLTVHPDRRVNDQAPPVLGTPNPEMGAAMKILVTGGAGYIGSVTAKALEEAGHTPVILDSLLTGPRVFVKDRIFYQGDIADRQLERRVVVEHPDLDASIHMAARIIVLEMVAQHYEHYCANVATSLELYDELEMLRKP